VRTDVEDGEDIRVVERGGCAGFEFKSPQPISVFGEFGGQDFDCDIPTEPLIARAIHFTHPASAERGDDAIVRDSFRNHRGYTSRLAAI